MRVIYMKRKSVFTRLALGGALLAASLSQAAIAAGSYTSSVVLPSVYARNFLETADVPVKGNPPANGAITYVSWTWNVAGYPQGLSVYLCQGSTSNCVDVSRTRRMSTEVFKGKSPAQPFFFAMRVGSGGTVPVSGQQAQVIVNWQ
ncbi:flagellar protein FlhE [Dickeya solani]|nr:flagellar protein FlhE [Dickeya solani]MBJ2338607.1 flagellar protein FlhE [Dickeya solani]MBJ2343073.1 flagellar protein FlhE [Dickeya solani]MBJ2353457.1 flagellar protein FlhE [Dickeya solani]MZG52132.1 flagellar protein FlhE [Dickeya solani]